MANRQITPESASPSPAATHSSSRCRSRSRCSPGRHSHWSPSQSPSCSLSTQCSHRYLRRHRGSIPYRYYPDSIELAPALSPTNKVKISSFPKEGSLLTDHTSNGQVAFYTTLQMTMKHGSNFMMVKIDPGVQASTIPPSRYSKMFPHKVTKARNPKQGPLHPTSKSWIPHNGKPQPFLGKFIADICHITKSRSYHTHFHGFEDVTNIAVICHIGAPRDLRI